MSRFCCAIALLSLAWSASPAQADGLLYQLPKDGTWATYDIKVAVNAPVDASMKGTIRLASVGQVTEDKQPCRWIEVQFDMEVTMGEHQDKHRETYKLLIPEKYLAKGESPLEHVVRAWAQKSRKDNKGEAKELKDPNSIEGGPLPILLSGPWKDVKQLDKTEVESKLGKLACEGVAGTLEFKFKVKGDKVMKCKLENRTSAKSPFGVVTSHWTIEAPDVPMAGTMEWNLKLADFGENAKSELPDAK